MFVIEIKLCIDWTMVMISANFGVDSVAGNMHVGIGVISIGVDWIGIRWPKEYWK